MQQIFQRRKDNTIWIARIAMIAKIAEIAKSHLPQIYAD
jgi:hypothetical protein